MEKIIITNDDVDNKPSQSSFSPELQSLPQQYSPIPNNYTVSNTKPTTNPFVVFTIILLLILVVILGAIVVTFSLGGFGGVFPIFKLQDNNAIYKENIKKIIQLDHQYFEPVRIFSENPPSDLSENEKWDQRAQLIFNYIQNAKNALNYDKLPSDFVSAYMSHLNAWEQYRQEVVNHPDLNIWSNVTDVLVHTLMGDFFRGFEKSDILEEYISRLKQKESAIPSTWNEVEAVAGKYGINVNNVEQ